MQIRFMRTQAYRSLTGYVSALFGGSYSRIGGGTTGTIRPSTSPRMPTTGFEVRGNHSPARPWISIQGCSEFEGRGRPAGLCCLVHVRPPALLSRLLSKMTSMRSDRGTAAAEDGAQTHAEHNLAVIV